MEEGARLVCGKIAENFGFPAFPFRYPAGMQILVILLLLAILLALYDFRRGEIPNWVSWPLLLAGILAHAPGTLAINVSSVYLGLAWFVFPDQTGAGDLKLWLALLWLVPPSMEEVASTALFAVLALSAALQILLGRLRKGAHPPGGRAAPAAWRAAVFMAVLDVLQWVPIQHV